MASAACSTSFDAGALGSYRGKTILLSSSRRTSAPCFLTCSSAILSARVLYDPCRVLPATPNTLYVFFISYIIELSRINRLAFTVTGHIINSWLLHILWHVQPV